MLDNLRYYFLAGERQVVKALLSTTSDGSADRKKRGVKPFFKGCIKKLLGGRIWVFVTPRWSKSEKTSCSKEIIDGRQDGLAFKWRKHGTKKANSDMVIP